MAEAKHGTHTPDGQKRTRARRAAKLVTAGIVSPDATRREVDAALKAARIDFAKAARKVFTDHEDQFVHVTDVELSISQIALAPYPTLTGQVPLAYAGDLVELCQFGGGPIFARLYRLRPMGVNGVVAEALERIAELNHPT